MPQAKQRVNWHQVLQELRVKLARNGQATDEQWAWIQRVQPSDVKFLRELGISAE